MEPSDPRRADTRLRRQLVGATTARPTALDAFRHARRTFLDGDRVDMQALARTLNVDRATLYRWVGSREQLLTEILWSLIEPTITKLRQNASGSIAVGQSPAAAVITGSVRQLRTSLAELPGDSPTAALQYNNNLLVRRAALFAALDAAAGLSDQWSRITDRSARAAELTIALDDTPAGGTLRVEWGSTSASVPFTVG